LAGWSNEEGTTNHDSARAFFEQREENPPVRDLGAIQLAGLRIERYRESNPGYRALAVAAQSGTQLPEILVVEARQVPNVERPLCFRRLAWC
jgi:hypothetical protein